MMFLQSGEEESIQMTLRDAIVGRVLVSKIKVCGLLILKAVGSVKASEVFAIFGEHM